ncbi:MAG: hypothetical protein DSM107014_05350 [Gomphosphaeria aponina SAG 52.96 = DSM 107014]|uniref:CopG family transcriptional regulator n=1 Tax=Gomphosphaeria aponina SAG 52.96 = DSM 107014 TaxID=1521640 RepID=A0A941JST2_9CHRO|nr:hypothetical protein [Gomphosphaeria aponina SAG 52.96 = DSM 107014]
MKINISLSPEQEKFIQTQVNSGSFTSPNEVISEALEFFAAYQRQNQQFYLLQK